MIVSIISSNLLTIGKKMKLNPNFSVNFNMTKNNFINRKNKSQLIKDLENEQFNRKTCSFYRYTNIEDPHEMRNLLLKQWLNFNILGRVYIAKEGINAQISVPEYLWNEFISSLDKYNEFKSINIKKALIPNDFSFIKLIIRVKNKLVADGLSTSEYNLNKTGTHLSAAEFNRAINDPNSIIVDMRNYYESEVGHFKDAICPDVATFKEALPHVKNKLSENKNNKLLLYCTGGIRCEKASSYLIQNGFKDVNQLNGGIIEYTHQINNSNLESQFIGKNFVFDSRMNESVTDDIISYCHQCNSASSQHVNCSNQACHILFIQCEKCIALFQGCCSEECKEIIQLSIEDQKKLRKNPLKAAPLKQFQKSVKPKLKDLLEEKNKINQEVD
tara:strand:+ start:143 stop:1303 length:1161 start_codon:yes stop_codon:yes gene_type:complete